MDDYQPNENEEKSPYPTTEAPGIRLLPCITHSTEAPVAKAHKNFVVAGMLEMCSWRDRLVSLPVLHRCGLGPLKPLYRSVRFDLVLCKALYCKIQNFTESQIV